MFVRNNVKAWLRKPELGMIPLFMAGDKAFFYHANQLKKQTGIDLVIFVLVIVWRMHTINMGSLK